jgi:hypothetical protein
MEQYRIRRYLYPMAEIVYGPYKGKPPTPKPPPVPCPVCTSPLRVTRVNVSRCTNIGGPWKISIMCSNPNCYHNELSQLSSEEWKNGPHHS